MGISELSGDELSEAERQIEWVLAHPGMSGWLKGALRTALHQDPVHLLNDLEILGLLLRARSQAVIDQALRNPRRPF
ncbi:hypothetical protein [Bradyrhizobium sp. 2TAF24]|jgi:hypothetical protein|uniref:hypothetical protein n=1 Tax=Bradyrhizobium sp. 2TAF24 TaxID=3233011 RepID=UPI003F91E67E